MPWTNFSDLLIVQEVHIGKFWRWKAIEQLACNLLYPSYHLPYAEGRL